MRSDQNLETLNEIFKNEGVDAVVVYLEKTENLSREDAHSECAKLGFIASAPSGWVEGDVVSPNVPIQDIPQNLAEHIVTQEDLDNNPGEDLVLGETILIPAEVDGTPKEGKFASFIRSLFK